MVKIPVLLKYIRRQFGLKKEEAEEITYKEVEDNIYFYGHNLWILFFSMIIACIGLNMNSTAAVIGAMLISPLMGPIIGIGFGFAIYDFSMIGRAAKHWLLAVIISLSASTLYFLVTPVTDTTSQLFSFTRPTVFDALLAFFGGLAGFLGVARKDGSKVIAGVAIATACMPPLCTAGYGLATLQWDFLWGGFYFFLINCLFIGVSSMLLAKYMHFTKRNRFTGNNMLTKHGVTIAFTVSLLALIPCIFIFIDMMREDRFKKKAESFVTNISTTDYSIIGKQYHFKKDTPVVELTFVGSVSDHASHGALLEKLQQYVSPSKLVLHYTNMEKNVNQRDLDSLITRINRHDSIIKMLQNLRQ